MLPSHPKSVDARRRKYPPDQQVNAIDLVLQQAETLAEDLAEAA